MHHKCEKFLALRICLSLEARGLDYSEIRQDHLLARTGPEYLLSINLPPKVTSSDKYGSSQDEM